MTGKETDDPQHAPAPAVAAGAAEAGGHSAPSLSSLVLTEFRNYHSQALSLGPEPVVLYGDNGAGKTNLLEAVSLLSPGRGLRRATFDALARAGGDGTWTVSARIESGYGPVTVGTGWRAVPGSDERRRITRIDGGTVASSEAIAEFVRVLWLTPAMDGLFTGGASDRRRYLDRLVLAIDPAHGRRVSAFERAMRGRNRLLEDASADRGWFAAQEAQMAELGVAIAAARIDLVSRFAGYMQAIGGGGAFPSAVLALEGGLEATLAEHKATDAEDGYRERLARSRPRDRAAGRTLEGPHRCDLLVSHEGKQMPAALCSTGEQKALLLGLTLAHGRLVRDHVGMVPILLLDEVAAHLDAARRSALVQELARLGGQSWLTGTDRSLFSALEGTAQFFAVAEGLAQPG